MQQMHETQTQKARKGNIKKKEFGILCRIKN